MDLWFLMFAKTCVYINRSIRQESYKHKTVTSTFSAINPMLYSLMSTKFRRAFHRILSCRLGRGRGAYYDPRETTCATPSVAHHAATRQGEEHEPFLT